MSQESISYLTLGFDSDGLNTPVTPSFSDAGNSDAFLEEGAISSVKVRNISASKITAGTLSAVTNVGDDSIQLDGENHVIRIYDDSGNVSVYIAGGSA